MTNSKSSSPSRRDFFRAGRATAGAAGAAGRPGRQPGPCRARPRDAVGQAAEGRLLQRRPAGDLVRPGQAGGGILGQAVQRRRDLVRRRAAAPKQRAAIDNMASQKWDFVAIQAFGIGTLTAPVQQDDRSRHAGHRHGHADRAAGQINVHSFLAPDNEFMGASVTQALVDAIGGEGNDDHDPGRARPHRRAGPRPRVQVRGEEVSRRSRCWTRSPPTGT